MKYVEPGGSAFGHNVDPMQMGLEAYRLTAMSLSADPIEKISQEAQETGKGLVDSDTHWLEALRDRFFWDEVLRILIYLAIQGRLYRDMKSPFDKSNRMRELPIWKETCGSLEETEKRSKSATGCRIVHDDRKNLTLREAFNKIIHADAINPDVDADNFVKMLLAKKINPVVYLYGTQSGRAWRTTLDIIEFVRLLRRALLLGGSNV